MQVSRSVPASCGYVVTPEGRTAMAQEERCSCRIVLSGFWAVCPECGTCYANIREELARSSVGLAADKR